MHNSVSEWGAKGKQSNLASWLLLCEFSGMSMTGPYSCTVPKYQRINLSQRKAFPWLQRFQSKLPSELGFFVCFLIPYLRLRSFKMWINVSHLFPLIHKYHISSKLLKVISVVKKLCAHPSWPSAMAGLGQEHCLPSVAVTAMCESTRWGGSRCMKCSATIAQATENEHWQDHIARVLDNQSHSFLENNY